jgi:hypothetical protein
MKRAVKMRAGFLVNRDPIDTCLGERGNKFVGVFDHKVTQPIPILKFTFGGGPTYVEIQRLS